MGQQHVKRRQLVPLTANLKEELGSVASTWRARGKAGGGALEAWRRRAADLEHAV